jgi:hypothetical protein
VQDKLDKDIAERPTADELVKRGILNRESTVRPRTIPVLSFHPVAFSTLFATVLRTPAPVGVTSPHADKSQPRRLLRRLSKGHIAYPAVVMPETPSPTPPRRDPKTWHSHASAGCGSGLRTGFFDMCILYP